MAMGFSFFFRNQLPATFYELSNTLWIKEIDPLINATRLKNGEKDICENTPLSPLKKISLCCLYFVPCCKDISFYWQPKDLFTNDKNNEPFNFSVISPIGLHQKHKNMRKSFFSSRCFSLLCQVLLPQHKSQIWKKTTRMVAPWGQVANGFWDVFIRLFCRSFYACPRPFKNWKASMGIAKPPFWISSTEIYRRTVWKKMANY